MNRRAFTLIELVLAMAGCAVILAAIYGVFSRAVHLRDEAMRRTREARVRAHAFTVLRNDLRNAWVSGGRMAIVLEGSAQSKNGGFPGYLKFVTNTAPDDQDEVSNELQQVEYYVATDPASADLKSGVLVRTVNRDLLAVVQQTQPEQPLLSGVESMQVSFYDGDSWQDSWTVATVDDPLPLAVRVRIQTATDAVPFELLVPWTTQAWMKEPSS